MKGAHHSTIFRYPLFQLPGKGVENWATKVFYSGVSTASEESEESEVLAHRSNQKRCTSITMSTDKRN